MNQLEFNVKFKKETKVLALEVIRFFQKLPKTDECRIIGKQLLRSSTSVAANFRATCRGRSVREKFSKLSIVVEEADETLFWLELLQEAKLICVPENLLKRALSIIKVMAAYRKRMKEDR